MKIKLIARCILLGIPVIMICWQVYASNFEHLSRWRGGGYGMYTDSHPEHRSLVLKTADTSIVIYPVYFSTSDSISVQDQKLYNSSLKLLKFAAFYPEFYEKQVLHSAWIKHYRIENPKVEVYETYVDLENRRVYPHKIYDFE